MTPEQYEKLKDFKKPLSVSIKDVGGSRPHTLLYGYTCDRLTWHVYVDEQPHGPYMKVDKLHKVVYYFDHSIIEHVSGDELTIEDIIPDKRLYPEACDFWFCMKLYERGVELPFTTFNPERPQRRFHGLIVNAAGELVEHENNE